MNVLHFMPEGAERTACGARVFLCDESTDDPKWVDCKRCRATKVFKNYDPRRFNVDVWNYEGDVVDYRKRVSADEVDKIREEYADDPTVSVTVEEAGI